MARQKKSPSNPAANDGFGTALSTVSGSASGVPKDNAAVPTVPSDGLRAFKEALCSHRDFSRETDPPII